MHWCNKKMAKHVLKNMPRGLDITANVASAVASRNPWANSTTLLDVKTFINQAKDSSSENLFEFLSS